jgi:hypothetical protein
MFNNASPSDYKDIPQNMEDISSDSLSSDSNDSEASKSLVSVQLSGICKIDKNLELIEKSKDYYFDKENDDYKNFLNLCQDL